MSAISAMPTLGEVPPPVPITPNRGNGSGIGTFPLDSSALPVPGTESEQPGHSMTFHDVMAVNTPSSQGDSSASGASGATVPSPSYGKSSESSPAHHPATSSASAETPSIVTNTVAKGPAEGSGRSGGSGSGIGRDSTPASRGGATVGMDGAAVGKGGGSVGQDSTRVVKDTSNVDVVVKSNAAKGEAASTSISTPSQSVKRAGTAESSRPASEVAAASRSTGKTVRGKSQIYTATESAGQIGETQAGDTNGMAKAGETGGTAKAGGVSVDASHTSQSSNRASAGRAGSATGMGSSTAAGVPIRGGLVPGATDMNPGGNGTRGSSSEVGSQVPSSEPGNKGISQGRSISGSQSTPVAQSIPVAQNMSATQSTPVSQSAPASQSVDGVQISTGSQGHTGQNPGGQNPGGSGWADANSSGSSGSLHSHSATSNGTSGTAPQGAQSTAAALDALLASLAESAGYVGDAVVTVAPDATPAQVAAEIVSVLAPLQSSGSGSGSVTIRLEPPGMGTISAMVEASASGLSVHFQTDNVHAHELLSQVLQDIKDHLSSGSSGAVSVTVSWGGGSGSMTGHGSRGMLNGNSRAGVGDTAEVDAGGNGVLPGNVASNGSITKRLLDVKL